MPRSPKELPRPRAATAVAGLYLLVALITLLLPVFSGSTLVGVWPILLALPWSAFFPLGLVNHAAPGVAGAARFLMLLVAMLANAALLYLGIRWAGRWSAARRR